MKQVISISSPITKKADKLMLVTVGGDANHGTAGWHFNWCFVVGVLANERKCANTIDGDANWSTFLRILANSQKDLTII